MHIGITHIFTVTKLYVSRSANIHLIPFLEQESKKFGPADCTEEIIFLHFDGFSVLRSVAFVIFATISVEHQ